MVSSPSSSALFEPIKVGRMQLPRRIAMAPLTRVRASIEHCHTSLATEYYAQRASSGGVLIISEATFIAPQAGGMKHVPGVWNDDQVKAWKEIVDAVHAKGSFFGLQLWALGRAAKADVLKEEGGYDVVSSSDVPFEGGDKPRPLTKEEIKEYPKLYAEAARRFIEEAGGDFVEVHSANGYLIDQFTQTNSNKRTDEYGGSVENRTRFAREVIAAVSEAVGEDRVGFRLSPHSRFQGMRMSDEDLEETFSYLLKRVKEDHPDLAYAHLTEPRAGGGWDQKQEAHESINQFHKIWAPKPFIVAGAYQADSALARADELENTLVAFGRPFISNPDLPYRIKKGIPFTPYNRKTFYLQGPTQSEGYTDYPFANEESKSKL